MRGWLSENLDENGQGQDGMRDRRERGQVSALMYLRAAGDSHLPRRERIEGTAGVVDAPVLLSDMVGKGRKQAEGDVHRLERLPVGILDVPDERAQGGFGGRGDQVQTPRKPGGVDTGEETHRR